MSHVSSPDSPIWPVDADLIIRHHSRSFTGVRGDSGFACLLHTLHHTRGHRPTVYSSTHARLGWGETLVYAECSEHNIASMRSSSMLSYTMQYVHQHATPHTPFTNTCLSSPGRTVRALRTSTSYDCHMSVIHRKM